MTRWQLVFLDEKTALDLTDRGRAVWSLETGEAIRSSAHLISLGTVMKMAIRIVEKDRERVALLHRDGFLVFYPPSPNGETTKRTIEEDNLSLTPRARREEWGQTTMTGLQLRLGLRGYDLSRRPASTSRRAWLSRSAKGRFPPCRSRRDGHLVDLPAEALAAWQPIKRSGS